MLQIKSKYKVCKRLGSGVFEQCQTQRFTLAEARAHASKGRGRRRGGMSDYGAQLLEKQRVRFTYGLSERQFSSYVSAAMHEGDPAAALHKSLEMRLDNAVYRLGLASTRRAARQMTSHGHIEVNGRRMTVPSHHVRVGDKLTVRDRSKDSVLFSSVSDGEGTPPPNWLSLDAKTLTGSVVGEPAYVAGESLYDYQSVLEFYSR